MSNLIEQHPLISIVMPSYNQGEFIGRSIESFLAQTYRYKELIIIDGRSTDNTVKVLDKYRNEKSVKIVSEPDSGQSEALNKGFQLATGDILGWLNSDDLYMTDCFGLVASEFKKDKNLQYVYFDWVEIDRWDEILVHNYAFDFSLAHLVYEGFFMNTQSSFWTREIHNKLDVFDTDLCFTMDYDFLIQVGQNLSSDKCIKRIELFAAGFRRHDGQKTQLVNPSLTLELDSIYQKFGYLSLKSKIRYIIRFFFRLRRSFWYFKRLGFRGLLIKFYGR